ncbi:MAG: glycosyltransferase family 2 protein [Thermoplasmata archaeon]|nr:glycosyltransferase family 2 protein [Thermoplasmata archaeon]MCI4359387.1 glycosyltransferase family 2 protein [Thermoplasmata archaeon]
MSVPTVVFQVTAIGKNPESLQESVESVLYWVRNTPRVGFRYLIWVVVEPLGYVLAPRFYQRLRRQGVRVLMVPPEYRTPLGTRGKARALEYACAQRRAEGMSTPSFWVYHQDEETCVGQDTLQGLSEFIDQGRKLVGVGMILYPLDWAGTPSHVQELARSYDDLRLLDSMTMPGNPTAGCHGSHILVRADVEDSVGWDAPGYNPTEDLAFEIRVRARYGSVFGLLSGFAYEKGAFSLHDQLRQRRRWVHGVLHALFRLDELPLRRRLTVAYSALAWFSALPSVLLLLGSAALHYGRLTAFTGVFTGFVWISIVVAYVEGYRLHAAYLERHVAVPWLFANGVLGALIDIVAPWYALFTRPTMGDFIAKDRPPSGIRWWQLEGSRLSLRRHRNAARVATTSLRAKPG